VSQKSFYNFFYTLTPPGRLSKHIFLFYSNGGILCKEWWELGAPLYMFIIYWEQYSNVLCIYSPGREINKKHTTCWKLVWVEFLIAPTERGEKETNEGGPASLKIKIQFVHLISAKASPPGDNIKHCGALISDEIKLRVNVSASEKESGMALCYLSCSYF